MRTLSGDAGPSTFGLSTLDSGELYSSGAGPPPTLTVLLHPDGRRIGEHAPLPELSGGVPVAVSRNGPRFGLERGRPLDHPRVSRKPLWLTLKGDQLELRPGKHGLPVRVDGEPLSGGLSMPADALDEEGVLIELGGCVLLWLHRPLGAPPALDWNGLVGLSPGMQRTRQRVGLLGPTRVPVLIRGESGAGKERVARALHAASPRAERPWVAVNLAAVPDTVAPAELFGHGRGAFTGAVGARKGWFEEADGGTLFLDEVGEASPDLQPLLLRALDSGEIQPVGRPVRKVDVRLVTATDADLEALVESGRFRPALYHRLRSAELHVPPLRDRPADIAVLLHHFLCEHLAEFGAAHRLLEPDPEEKPWLGSGLVVTLMRYRFPGNVRELRSLAFEIAACSHADRVAALPQALERRVEEGAREKVMSSERPPEDPLLGLQDALRRNRFVIGATARELGVAKNTLLRAIRESPELHLAQDLEEAQIEAALEQARGDIEAAAFALEVSSHGLKLRMNALGLHAGPR
ncbi:MAG: sigma-54-dependent Fis family transcriptional regulator [Alphaproteobacteria bacterium]|nr:sigma-54-dependent Fis family transcriptional regulator [Alphaproteobacteria bacterium]